jgi:hypothetical protein
MSAYPCFRFSSIPSALFLLAVCIPAQALAQTTSGSISGQVVDSNGGSVPRAVVVLTEQTTGVRQSTTTETSGDFTFPSVLPGIYTIEAQSPGFKKLTTTNLNLAPTGRLSAGVLKLEVGSISESVTVMGQATPVQTASEERSAVIDHTQMQYLSNPGRDYANMLKVLPGVTYPDNYGSAELQDSTTTPFISGIKGEYQSINLDGAIANNRSYAASEAPLNIDAVAEVQVLQSNYQAEFGRTAGPVINVVSKGGSRQFHGSGYFYLRNEALNANDFFNNRNGTKKAKYRYDTIGWNLGGPVTFGKKFDKLKDKLFFFYSEEVAPNTRPGGLRTYTVPTALERQGDYSQSFNPNGSLIVVKDPTTGQPFPGNIVPANRINSNGQKLLGVFPLPNFTNRAISGGNYNLLLNDYVKTPSYQEFLRLDYSPTSKWRFFVSKLWHNYDSDGLATTANGNAWGVDQTYNTVNPHVSVNATFMASPTLVNDLTFGYAGWYELQSLAPSQLAKIQKSALGITFGSLFAGNNPLNVVPAMSFGGVTGAASVSYDARFPMYDYVKSYSISDGLTKIIGTHSLKAGIYAEPWGIYYQDIHPGWGSMVFGTNANWPQDSGYAYANALMGNFQTYSEPTNSTAFEPVNKVMEWYVQDNWKLTKRLTLDYGIRFTYDIPQYSSGNQISNFEPSQYSVAAAPTFYTPALNANGQRVARNPLTGDLYPVSFIGLFVPGTGNIAQATVKAGTAGYPRSFLASNGVLFAPRFGFAWDPFGDGKTAIRAGAGIYYDARPQSGEVGNMESNPPVVYTPTYYYGNLGTFSSAAGLLGPPNFSDTIQGNGKMPTVYQYSFGIQRNIGFKTVADVAYVGNVGNHLGDTRNINAIPYGARFLPQNQDPTTGKPLPDAFLLPYLGMGSIPYMEFGSNSNYNSLQAQLKHSFTHGLSFNVAYTFSKAMDYADSYNGNIANYNSPRFWNYAPAGFDRTHTLVSNWVWDIPNGTKLWNNRPMHWAFDGWQTSGIAAFVSGAPKGVSMTLTDGADLTGGGDGTTPVVTGSAVLPKSQQTFTQFFNTSVFQRPALGQVGSGALASRYAFRGPGINNWDISLFKNFKVGERVNFQFRWETYNTFNHPQFSGVNTSFQFNAAGQQVNPQVGQLTSDRSPRLQQLALRLSF